MKPELMRMLSKSNLKNTAKVIFNQHEQRTKSQSYDTAMFLILKFILLT